MNYQQNPKVEILASDSTRRVWVTPFVLQCFFVRFLGLHAWVTPSFYRGDRPKTSGRGAACFMSLSGFRFTASSSKPWFLGSGAWPNKPQVSGKRANKYTVKVSIRFSIIPI